MKSDLGDPICEGRESARATIFEYIEIWYNRERRHSSLGYLSPEQYESQLPIAVSSRIQNIGTSSNRWRLK